jgi:predicted acetyltransferase
MRPVYACVCLIAAFAALPAFAAQPASSTVTVVLDFKGSYSAQARREMQREADTILRSSGVRLDWKLLEETRGHWYTELVVITFKGVCEYDPELPRHDDPGPYGMTMITDGQIQPFGVVECNRVVGSARTAMLGRDRTLADMLSLANMLVGRALGRVVAHELVHILTKSVQHAKVGVEKPALSGWQLIASSLSLSAEDNDRIKLERATRNGLLPTSPLDEAPPVRSNSSIMAPLSALPTE